MVKQRFIKKMDGTKIVFDGNSMIKEAVITKPRFPDDSYCPICKRLRRMIFVFGDKDKKYKICDECLSKTPKEYSNIKVLDYLKMLEENGYYDGGLKAG